MSAMDRLQEAMAALDALESELEALEDSKATDAYDDGYRDAEKDAEWSANRAMLELGDRLLVQIEVWRAQRDIGLVPAALDLEDLRAWLRRELGR